MSIPTMINAVRGGFGGPRAGHAEMGLRKEMGPSQGGHSMHPQKVMLESKSEE